MRPTKLGRIVALRACVLIGGARSPGFARTIGRLPYYNMSDTLSDFIIAQKQ